MTSRLALGMIGSVALFLVAADILPECDPNTIFKAACTVDANCTAGLRCHQTEGTCQCLEAATYWNGQSCLQYKKHGDKCSPSVECLSPLKCSAEDETCQCLDTAAYWDGAICQNKDRPPVLTSQPPESVVYFKPGNNVTLNYTADGYPYPSYDLHSDVVTLRFTQESIRPGIFELPGALESDVGVYWVNVSNSHGVSTSLNASLKSAYISNFTSSDSETHNVNLGGAFTMSCDQPDSEPIAEVSWQRVAADGSIAALASTERVQLGIGGDLQFRSIHDTDSLTYRCVATNKFLGEIKYGRNQTFNIQGTLTETAVTQHKVPAASVAVDGGKPVILECIFSGNPIPKVYWEKIGGDLPECRHKFVNWRSQLHLTAATDDDMGDYQCIGINTVSGVDKVSRNTTTVAMQFAPVWIKKPVSQEKMIGDDATFSCQANGNPAPQVTWKLNGEDIASSKFASRVTYTETTLTFGNVNRDDVTSVQCIVSNSVGTDAAYAVLNVFGPPDPVQFTAIHPTSWSYDLSWMPPQDGGQRILRYVIEWIQITVKTTNGITVKNSEVGSRLSHVLEGTDHGNEYKIRGLKSSTSYEVTIKAVNAVGESQMASRIITTAKGQTSGSRRHTPSFISPVLLVAAIAFMKI